MNFFFKISVIIKIVIKWCKKMKYKPNKSALVTNILILNSFTFFARG